MKRLRQILAKVDWGLVILGGLFVMIIVPGIFRGDPHIRSFVENMFCLVLGAFLSQSSRLGI